MRFNFKELENLLPVVLGEGPSHLKRHHGYSGELSILHTHFTFAHDVTPDTLEQFLNIILRNQKKYPGQAKYQFINDDTAALVSDTFKEFYREFAYSNLQMQFFQERRLTIDEKRLLSFDAEMSRGGLSNDDKAELRESGVRVP